MAAQPSTESKPFDAADKEERAEKQEYDFVCAYYRLPGGTRQCFLGAMDEGLKERVAVYR